MSIRIKVTNPDTKETKIIEGLAGYQVMEVIRDNDLPILAECGGALACATCHVKIQEAWLDKLPTMLPEEQDMLDLVSSADKTSRLCCQIIVTPELNGLELSLTDESLRR